MSRALPPLAHIDDIRAHPARYADKRVRLVACYVVDPYHGAVLYEPSRRGLGLKMFGGSDDLGANFDWMKQQVCGTVIGRFRWHVKEEPLSLLCPDQCFDSEGTLNPRVVAGPDWALNKER